jgi:hypothetical protein
MIRVNIIFETQGLRNTILQQGYLNRVKRLLKGNAMCLEHVIENDCSRPSDELLPSMYLLYRVICECQTPAVEHLLCTSTPKTPF